MHKAWIEVGDILEHIGIDMNPSLGNESAHELLLAHYSLGKGRGYDCEQVVADYGTFPPVAALVRKYKHERRTREAAKLEDLRKQAKQRKRKWRERQAGSK